MSRILVGVKQLTFVGNVVSPDLVCTTSIPAYWADPRSTSCAMSVRAML